MRAPECAVCEKKLENWAGNVMVDSVEYPDKVNKLVIMCKECTAKLDRKGIGQKWHNLWELRWVRDDFIDLIEEVFEEFTGQNSTRWSQDAIKDLLNLGKLIHKN